MRRLALILVALAGCGRGGAHGGGDDHLPTQAAGPYRELESDLETPLEEPFVLSDMTADLSEPSILDGDQYAGRGDRIIVYAERRDNMRSTIVRADVDPELAALTEPPDEVLAPAEAWEGTRVGAPAIFRRGDKVLLFYEGDGGIGRALSMDGGRTFTRIQRSPVLVSPGARQPSVIASPADPDREVLMYFAADGAGGPAIFRARSSDDGQSWSDIRQILMAAPPRTTDGGPIEFDLAGVEAPCAWGPLSAVGEPYVGLFYVGVAQGGVGRRAIGYAASHDGISFQRFPGGAVLSPGGADELAPALRREPDQGILLYTVLASGRLRIAAARHVARSPLDLE